MTKEIYLLQAGVYCVMVFALIFHAIHRGRRLWRETAAKYPDFYESLGKPMPGLFDSPRRQQHFLVINTRAYQRLDDELLVERFERQRGFEYRMFFVLIGGLMYLGAVGYLNKDNWGV